MSKLYEQAIERRNLYKPINTSNINYINLKAYKNSQSVIGNHKL